MQFPCGFVAHFKEKCKMPNCWQLFVSSSFRRLKDQYWDAGYLKKNHYRWNVCQSVAVVTAPYLNDLLRGFDPILTVQFLFHPLTKGRFKRSAPFNGTVCIAKNSYNLFQSIIISNISFRIPLHWLDMHYSIMWPTPHLKRN